MLPRHPFRTYPKDGGFTGQMIEKNCTFSTVIEEDPAETSNRHETLVGVSSNQGKGESEFFIPKSPGGARGKT